MISLSTFNDIAFAVFILTLSFMITVFIFEIHKTVKAKTKPFISFMIPTHNDADYIVETVESVFKSNEQGRFEVIVINDKSTDNTLDILETLGRKYPIQVINNKINLGKSKSINCAFPTTKGEIIWILDSDTKINGKIVQDSIARLEDEKVGGVSRRPVPINRGFLASMQRVEYGMYGLIQVSYNPFSTVALWGASIAVKRGVFEKVGMFSDNFLTEDQDLALKIGETGMKTQEGILPIHTYVPETLEAWYQRTVRWSGGAIQNFIIHFKFFMKNPVVILFLVTNVLLAIAFLVSFVNNFIFLTNFFVHFDSFRDTGNSFFSSFGFARTESGMRLDKIALLYLLYPLFSIPYVAVNYDLRKEPSKIWLIFPYSLVYYPIFTFVCALGFIKGIYVTLFIPRGKRAW